MKNLDSIVNQILAEAFDPNPHEAGHKNVVDAGNGPEKKGGVERQMISGELVSSPAFFFQLPSTDIQQKLTGLLDAQSKSGLGELVGLGKAVNEFVEAYLEDTAVEMYTNPNNVDYLINSLRESGYDEYASAIDAITLNPTVDDVAKINKMVESLSKEPNTEYFVESLIYIGEQIVDEAEAADTPTGDTSAAEETPKSPVDQSSRDNSGGNGSAVTDATTEGSSASEYNS